MNNLLRSQLTASVERARLADDHLDRAVIFLTHAIVYLDEACKLDPVLCKRVEAIPHQDELEIIRNRLRSLALDDADARPADAPLPAGAVAALRATEA